MIHTVELLFPLEYTEVKRLFFKYNVNPERFEKFGGAVKQLKQEMKKQGEFSAYSITWISCKGNGSWNIHLKIDVLKIVGRSLFTEDEYENVEADIRKFLISQFGHSSYFNNHRLTRVDYRFDVIIKNESYRNLIFHLFEKYTEKYGFKVKVKWGKDEDKAPLKYETSQYHHSKSVEFIIYSKNEEREAKNEKLEAYEENVIRYELRLKNDHLNGMARSDKGKARPKKLKEYFKDELYFGYMKKHIYPIIGKGDYYKITKAEKIIENSHFSRKKREKLRAFLVKISENSIDAPKKHLHEKTHKKYLKDLESIGINPILIPKNRKDYPSFMKNPFNI